MIITVASYKGGCGKTTTAVHLAAYLQTRASCLLLDADATRNAINWNKRGAGLPFRVAPYSQAAALVRGFEHVVIDTGQRPTDDDLQAAAEAGDSELLVIPATPSPLDTDSLLQTVSALQKLKATRFIVLLTKVSVDAAKDAAELRELLAEMNAPVFSTQIPRLKAFEKAAGAGQIVSQTDDRNAARAWETYAAAGKVITG
jgi:chromosome partitioning protein